MTNPPAETQGFVFNQTMMRIKDPAASLDFYQQVLGMTLYQRVDFADMSFSLYFMGYPSNHEGEPLPANAADRSRFTFQQSALLDSRITGVRKTTRLLRGITTATQSLRLRPHRHHGARRRCRLPALCAIRGRVR